MLTAYFDESGTNKNQSKVLTIAGYLSTSHRWNKFVVEWQALLESEGLEYCHAVEMAHFRKQFSHAKGWNKERRLNFEEQAHKIIRENTMQSFDISLLWEDYDYFIPLCKGPEPIPPAYGLLVNQIMLNVGKWATENTYYEPIHYVFEKGVDAEGWVAQTYADADKDIATGGAFHFAKLTFEEGKREIKDRKPTIQLQSADINAYEICKIRNDFLSGRLARTRKLRGSLENLRGNDSTTYSINRDGLTAILRDLEKTSSWG